MRVPRAEDECPTERPRPRPDPKALIVTPPLDRSYGLESFLRCSAVRHVTLESSERDDVFWQRPNEPPPSDPRNERPDAVADTHRGVQRDVGSIDRCGNVIYCCRVCRASGFLNNFRQARQRSEITDLDIHGAYRCTS